MKVIYPFNVDNGWMDLLEILIIICDCRSNIKFDHSPYSVVN